MIKTERYIRHALQLGWRVSDDGVVYNSKGVPRAIKKRGKDSDPIRKQYPRVSISMNDVQFSIEVHKLAAAYFLGQAYWEGKAKNLQVRHIDGNILNLSRSNIAMGTCSENNLDKCPEVRRKSAATALTALLTDKAACPHCAKIMIKSVLYRWHLAKCGGLVATE